MVASSHRIKRVCHRFLAEECAPTIVEYGILVALIAAVVIVGAASMGSETDNLFKAMAGVLNNLAN